MDEKELNELLEKFARKEITEEEHARFVSYLLSGNPHQAREILEKSSVFFQKLDLKDEPEIPELERKIEANIDALSVQDNGRIVSLWVGLRKALAIAASVLLFASISFYLFQRHNEPVKIAAKTDAPITPGGNKAVLTLDKGKLIDLTEAKIGFIASVKGLSIYKVAEGQLVYKVTNAVEYAAKELDNSFHTLTVPLGGQFQVSLPDGTHVWLNASSSLKYPLFYSSNRQVSLTGEGYFEVAHLNSKDRKGAIPFEVDARNTKVQVLGTHFNVMAYNDESSTNTTLLEGSVRVSNGRENKLLKPGQMASSDQRIKVSSVDVSQAVAWKNGDFSFSGEDIKSIMRKISRWYNVSVEYRGAITRDGFVGTVPRSENIKEVLELLELTQKVHFKIEGRRVIVMP